MDYVNLGKTGLRVSRLCLGMMSFGRHESREWALDESEAEPIVRQAVEGPSWAEQLELSENEIARLEEPYVPHAVSGVEVSRATDRRPHHPDHGRVSRRWRRGEPRRYEPLVAIFSLAAVDGLHVRDLEHSSRADR